MQPRIEVLPETKLIGRSVRMSLAENKTSNLWSWLMPQRKEIPNTVGTDLYSVEEYDPGYFEQFNPATEFKKWAAIPVTSHDSIPEGMERLVIPEGLYAVFIHKGLPSDGLRTYQYIYGIWLPKSGYQLDARPHFALMGDKYRHDDPESEEEIWIPVRG